MGSYGNTWVRCSWCERWGKCTGNPLDPNDMLTDIDGIGVLCDPCYNLGYPPHYDYLWKLLRSITSRVLAGRVAAFAYTSCAEMEWPRVDGHVERFEALQDLNYPLRDANEGTKVDGQFPHRHCPNCGLPIYQGNREIMSCARCHLTRMCMECANAGDDPMRPACFACQQGIASWPDQH